MSFHLNRFHLVVGTYPKELLPQITPIFLQQDLQVSEQDWTILRVAEAELDAGGNKAGGIAEVRVSDSLCAGAWFTSSPRIGWGKPRLVG